MKLRSGKDLGEKDRVCFASRSEIVVENYVDSDESCSRNRQTDANIEIPKQTFRTSRTLPSGRVVSVSKQNIKRCVVLEDIMPGKKLIYLRSYVRVVINTSTGLKD